MPCSDGGYFNEQDLINTRARLNNVTKLLCEACKLLDELHYSINLFGSPELNQWWIAHKQIDKAREDKHKGEGI